VLWTRGETLWTLFDLGEWDELLQTADELIAWDRSRGGSYFGVMALSYRARVQLWRGEAGEASSLQEEFLPRARDIGDHQILAPALDIAAQIRHALGDLPAALDLVRELEERTRENRAFLAQNLTDPVRVCAAAGESRLARRLVEEAAELAARHRHAVLTGRAILAEAEGNAAEAADLYANAAEQWKEFGFALERGQALLGAGRCLLAIGRAGEAIDRLSAARGLFGGLDARPLVAQADDLLARATALTS
jgi:ATP/maltotriose-dependent transcriptional regulator MalT